MWRILPVLYYPNHSELSDGRPVLAALYGSSIHLLPPLVQATYIRNGIKVFSQLQLTPDEREQAAEAIITRLRAISSHDLGLLDEAAQWMNVVQTVPFDQQHKFFADPLNPVSVRAQQVIPPPESLDLEVWINPHVFTIDTKPTMDVDEYGRPKYQPREASPKRKKMSKKREQTKEELAKQKAERLERQKDDPFYINPDDVDDIPIVKLDLSDVPGTLYTNQ